MLRGGADKDKEYGTLQRPSGAQDISNDVAFFRDGMTWSVAGVSCGDMDSTARARSATPLWKGEHADGDKVQLKPSRKKDELMIIIWHGSAQVCQLVMHTL